MTSRSAAGHLPKFNRFNQRLTLSLPFFYRVSSFHRSSHACPRVETTSTRRRHRGVHADPHLSVRMTSLWSHSNCFAGINVHLASATGLLATPERNGRSSQTSSRLIVYRRTTRFVCQPIDRRSNSGRRNARATLDHRGMKGLKMSPWILLALFSLVSGQLDLPPLNEGSRNNVGGQFPPTDAELEDILARLDFVGTERCSANVGAQWAYETDVNEYTQLDALEAQRVFADFQNQAWFLISRIDRSNIRDPVIRRRLRYLSVVGPSALPPDQLDRYNRVINDMLAVYNEASICAYNDPFRCGLRLYPDISQIMARSRNWDELQYVWTEWRRRSGMRIKDLYQQLVTLNNEAAKLNNFTDAAEYWMFPYESPNLQQDIDEVWELIRPLYEELHAYVRRKLRDSYGPEKIGTHAPLPAHILGNIWAQSWTNIIDITLPYPGKNYLDVTQEMQAQGFTPIDMFRIAEEFYLSLNLSAMPPEFWAGSIITDPGNRPLICQASAWDFCNRLDYRIKMCTKITMKDLITVHHEMAHIQYFLRYSGLPREFRDGANPGFHEAVGEAVALSVGSPRHLQTLGLGNKYIDEATADINYLFSLAMDKLVMMPFSIAMDRWRWDVFRGYINREDYNCHWHRLMEQYAGTKPPVLRSEDDFDPGAKYHIPANIPYIRNFVAGVLQFQLYRALCQAAGQRNVDDPRRPLHRCDFYGSPEAGRVLGKIMEKGSSMPWQETLREAIGEDRLDASALREYFRPLEDWLRTENLRTSDVVGWSYDGDYCKRSIETAGLQVYGSGFYNGASTNAWFTAALPGIATILLILSVLR